MPPQPRASNADPVEAQARADLAAGRWRKARDAFKALSKRDREQFLPLLVEANVGLARSMLDKRLVSDAQQVLTYLKTIASPECIAALASEIAATASGSAPIASAASPVALLARGVLPLLERQRVSDQLVAEFTEVDADLTVPEQAGVVADLHAIQHAIEALCAGDPDRALDLVRPVKRDSEFAQWRLFVKGVAAFQHGNADKAVATFHTIPSISVPGRASAAWLLALGRAPTAPLGNKPDAVLEAAGTLVDGPGWGKALARADALWHAGKHAASYRTMRDAKASFPSEGIDLGAVISSLYFNSALGMGERSGDAYLDSLMAIEVKRSNARPSELPLIRRIMCLVMTSTSTNDFDSADVRSMWEGFIQGYERVHGPNPRLASTAWAWLGDVLLRPPARREFGLRASQKADNKSATDALNRSIALDPANVHAHLLLATAHKAGKRDGDLNRVLDLMVSRFPAHKDVLLAAASTALEHKAYAKAIKYLDRALVLDRLDPHTADHLTTACLKLALQHFQKGRAADARVQLDRAGELAVDLPDNLVRGRWCLLVRHGVLESMYGDAATGDDLLAQARSLTAGSAPFLFFARMAWHFYDDRRRPFPREHQASLDLSAKTGPNAREAVTLVQIWAYWKSGSNHPYGEAKAWLWRYLKAAARTPFTRDDAARLLAISHRHGDLIRESRAFTSRILKQDPNDPLIRVYHEILAPFPTLTVSQQRAILDEARRRGDAAAEQLLRDVVGEIGAPDFGDPDDDEGDEMSNEEFVERFGMDGGDDLVELLPGAGVFREDEQTAELLELIARTPPSGIAALKKKRPKGMPAPLFDLLVMLARGAVPDDTGPRPEVKPAARRPVTPPPAKPRRGKVHPPMPDQPDLF